MSARTNPSTTAKATEKDAGAKVTRQKKVAPRGDAWRERFLRVLAQTGNVSASCRAAGRSRKEAYQQRAEDKEFAELWADALEEGADELEAVMLQQARDGNTVAGIFLLKGMRPEKYRERYQADLTHRDADPLEGVDTDAMRDEIARRGIMREL